MPARRLPWFFAFGLASSSAFAQATGPATQSTPSLPVVEMDEPPPPLVPPAHDTLTGHFIAGLGAAIEAPLGALTTTENASELGAGYGAVLDLGFGVSRVVSLGLWGNLMSYGSNQTGYAVGPAVTYHLVQGVRFDPWVRFGLGYRALNLEAGGVKRHFAGIEFAHVVVGGDYYAWSGVGFGPWLDFDAGAFTRRPSTNSAGQPNGDGPSDIGVHYGFSGGLRVVLDLPGK